MGKQKGLWLLVAAVVILLAAWALSKNNPTPKQAEETSTPTPTVEENKLKGTVKLGFVGPLTGDAATLGENVKIAVQLATDEMNAKGGVNGKKVEVIYEDGKCNAKDATSAGTKLINIDKVTAIIGGLCSGETLAIAPLVEKAKIPLISHASTNPKITDAGDYVFRFIASDSFQGVYAADYLVKTKGLKKIALLSCLNDWCVGLKDVFKMQAINNGATIVAEESFKTDTHDLRSQLTKIKAAKPEVIYFPSMTEGALVGLKQMKELGIKTLVLGGDGWDDPKIPNEGGTFVEGGQYTIAANRSLPEIFLNEMKKRDADKNLNTYSPRAYDIFNVLTSIISKVGTDGTKIKNELYNVQNYQGIADEYSLDKNGDVKTAKFIVKEFKGGKAVEVK